MIFILHALSWADCNDWDGIYSDTHPILAQTKSVTLLLEEEMEVSLAEQNCVDVSGCTWSLSNEMGLLETDIGSSNLYFAPDVVEDCEDSFAILAVSCPADGEEQTDRVEIEISCGDLDPDNPTFWKPSGGGCNSPTYAYILFLPFLSLFRRRKRTIQGNSA
ncbi:MAG: hypothetical protein VX278_16740 [Myxococcota bacterium]|nr:hypothetical protein [Myxococcota bacterium]